ncbi:MAG: PQQ-binding-like beta-propeller repeat protein [Acidobacteriota bacterium]
MKIAHQNPTLHRLALMSACALVLLTLSGPSSLAAQEREERFFDAARRGELAAVKQLLDAGVDVDAKTRYGATALSFAAEKGHVEVVQALLEAGADTNVRDTFYNSTPANWTLFKMQSSPAHREVLELILEKGIEESAGVLQAAVSFADVELVKKLVANSEVTPAQLRSALEQAKQRGVKKMIDYLEPLAPAADPVSAVELSAEELAAHAGTFANEQMGMKIDVRVKDGRLEGQVQGQGPFDLLARADGRFYSTVVPGVEMEFSGRAGTIERFVLYQNGGEFPFQRAAPVVEAQAAVADVAVDAEPEPPVVRTAARPWPQFRGEGAAGNADGQGIPLTWNAESGENVAWKVPVEGIALSSPVVFGDRVYVATVESEGADSTFRTGLYGDVDSVDDASEHAWKLVALELHSGKKLWETVAARGVPKVKRHLKSSHANPTPATDGDRIVVHFPSEGLFCYDRDGKELWKVDLGVLNSGWFYDPTYEWGFSSSPILHDGKVIVQVDIQEQSYVAAFALDSGRELWRTEREEIPTWGTPTILPAASDSSRDEVVTNGTTIRGYDAQTGEELWTLGPNSEVTVATPIVLDGVAYVTANYPPARPIYAVRPGGQGDLSLAAGESSNESIVWSKKRGGVYIPTPVAYRGLLYTMQMNGRLTAYDAATGEEIYRERVGKADSFSGSGIAADGRLYFTTETGTTYVVKAGRNFELLATNDLDEVVMTSAAASDGLLLIRTLDNLYALGKSAAAP